MSNQSQHLPDSAIALSMSNLTFSYAGSSSILNCIDWSLSAGQKVFLHGDSGSGKSTLLNLFCGIAKPNDGQLIVNGADVTNLSVAQLDQLRANHIGVVFQQFNLIPYLTVLQNIQLATYFAKAKIDTHAKVIEMLPHLGLSVDILGAKVSTLSVGQKQRVAIMRALVNTPELLLVDEPTSALDANARDGFMKMLLSICEIHGSAMVFVSHDTALREYFDTHVAMQDLCHWSSEEHEALC